MKNITAIVAVDNNWAIGKNNKLLYNIPEDMEFFKNTTTGNTVVYGYNTLLSLPNQMPLKNRTNIVMCFDRIEVDDAKVVTSVEELLAYLDVIPDNQEVFICGGQSVYRQLLYHCNYVLVTKIDAETENADAFFPNLDEMENWEMIHESNTNKSKQGLNFKFQKYKKI